MHFSARPLPPPGGEGPQEADIKTVVAVIRTTSLENVTGALQKIGVKGVTISEVRGLGSEVKIGNPYTIHNRIEIITPDAAAALIVNVIPGQAHRGEEATGPFPWIRRNTCCAFAPGKSSHKARGLGNAPKGVAMRCRMIIAALAALVLLSGCKAGETPRAFVGSPAPAFALQGLDGRTVRLADFRGTVVVMDFWATWCAPCKESTKEFEALHRKYGTRGVVMIGISMDKGTEASATVKKYAQENRVTYLMLMDDGRTSDAYAVRNIPATYILDRDHVLVKTYPGYQSGLGDRIAKEIERLMAKPERSAS